MYVMAMSRHGLNVGDSHNLRESEER